MDGDYHDYVRKLRGERRREAARLRRQGLSLRAIGTRLGVSHVQVLHDLDHADRPTEAPKPPPRDPSPNRDALLDAMSDGTTSTPAPRASAGWSGSPLSDPPQPGHPDMLDALTGPGDLDDIHAGHRTGPDSRFM